jgi:hypothetical protein
LLAVVGEQATHLTDSSWSAGAFEFAALMLDIFHGTRVLAREQQFLATRGGAGYRLN